MSIRFNSGIENVNK